MGWTGLFKRLRESEKFLEACFVQVLGQGIASEPRRYAGYDLVAVDATALCGPGAKGTDQRVHTVYDLSCGMPRSVDLTDLRGGEHLKRHASFGEGDLVLADRGYGYKSDVLACLKTGAKLLVRFEFHSFKLLDAETGQTISVAESERRLPQNEKLDLPVRIPECDVPLRALGYRNDKKEAVWLMTDLSPEELPLEEARELYRSRWQVELFFKRAKSILDLDELPTRDGPCARPWIWAKLTLAALAAILGGEPFSPWETRELPVEEVRQRTPQNPPRTPGRKAQKQTQEKEEKENQSTSPT